MLKKRKDRGSTEVNAGSMADIAFLLLIFFLVTTTIASDKGLTLLLPPPPEEKEEQIDIKIKEHNLFKILVNSKDQLLVENEPLDDVKKIKDMVKKFVLNNGKDPHSSDSPKDAIVSFKSDRGTSYEMYIAVLDEMQAAYYEMYGERVGLTANEFRALNKKKPKEKALYNKARKDFPMNISIAEPSKFGGN